MKKQGATMDLNTLQSLDGHAFEGLVADLLRAMGLRIERSKLSADGGVDVIAYCDEPFLKGTHIVQCKRQKAPVGEPVLRDLYGTVMSERAAKGILVTTSRFTRSARRFAADKPIELISGSELIGLLQEKGLLDAVGSHGITIPPQLGHLAYELNRTLRPILSEIDDIEKGYAPLPPARYVDLQRYLHEVSRTVESLVPTLESIVNIFNDLSHAAREGCLEPAEMRRKVTLIAKHVRTVKDLWVSSRRMRPPAIANSHYKAFVEFTHKALLLACSPLEVLQQKIDSAKAGAPSAKEATTVVWDLSPYIARMTKESKRIAKGKGYLGCLPVILAVLGAVILVGVWLH